MKAFLLAYFRSGVAVRVMGLSIFLAIMVYGGDYLLHRDEAHAAGVSIAVLVVMNCLFASLIYRETKKRT